MVEGFEATGPGSGGSNQRMARDNLQDFMDFPWIFPMKYGGFPVNYPNSANPWISRIGRFSLRGCLYISLHPMGYGSNMRGTRKHQV